MQRFLRAGGPGVGLIRRRINILPSKTISSIISMRSFSGDVTTPAPRVGPSAQTGTAGAGADIRPKPMIHHILTRMGERSLPTIKDSCTLEEAISHVHKCTAAALVVNKKDQVVGLYTAKDILRFIDKCKLNSDTSDTLNNFNIEKVMKETSRWVHCSPSDSVHRCREIMYQLKIRNLPVIEKGLLLGIVSLKHLSDSTFTAAGSGKKSGLLENLAGRRGFPKGTIITPCRNIQAVLAHEYKYHLSTYEPDSSVISNNSNSHQEDEGQYERGLADIISTTQSVPQCATSITYPPLQASVGSYGLPHPFKTHPKEGQRKGIVAPSVRHHAPGEMATDMTLCEDAFFVTAYPPPKNATHGTALGQASEIGTSIDLPKPGEDSQQLIYLCVADGVGSWRAFGIDPRLYAFTLVENARKVVDDFYAAAFAKQTDYSQAGVSILHPIDVLTQAWERTNHTDQHSHNHGYVRDNADDKGYNNNDNDALCDKSGQEEVKSEQADIEIEKQRDDEQEMVVGSSTICVATIDLIVNQLYYSNIGDSGLIVLRHIDAGVAGYMHSRDNDGSGSRKVNRCGRDSHLRIAYISQQQLKSFNLPYQVGFSNLKENPAVFETPMDADTASIPLHANDIILFASDGLFDNVDLDAIVDMVADWEDEFYCNDRNGNDALTDEYAGKNATQILSERLTWKARELSIDTSKDSPFSLLAKDNDIMWNLGGKPDDTVVIVARIADGPQQQQHEQHAQQQEQQPETGSQ